MAALVLALAAIAHAGSGRACNSSSWLQGKVIGNSQNLQRIHDLPTAGACCAQCTANAKCGSWTYHTGEPTPKLCYLHPLGSSSITDKPHHVSGFKGPAPPSPSPSPSPAPAVVYTFWLVV